ncbi:peptidase inhibitor family I36 protein [Streptomyces sp. NPDC050287]|uniref:peptidase inhibitor family I36 protein n=1 Tax=Streptomyces sp. NPDC050287 TaxID=3365608 RepID=UPI0037A613D5
MTTRTRRVLGAVTALGPLLITAPTADAACGCAAGQAAGIDCADGYVCIHPEINFGGQPWVNRAADGSIKDLPSAIRDRGSSVRNNSGRTAPVYEKRNYSGRSLGLSHQKRWLHPRPARLQPQRHRPLHEDQPQRLRMTPHQRCPARQRAVLEAVRACGNRPKCARAASAPVRTRARRIVARHAPGAEPPSPTPHRMPRLVGHAGFQQPPTARACPGQLRKAGEAAASVVRCRSSSGSCRRDSCSWHSPSAVRPAMPLRSPGACGRDTGAGGCHAGCPRRDHYTRTARETGTRSPYGMGLRCVVLLSPA